MVYQVWGTFDNFNSMWFAKQTDSFADANKYAKAQISRYPEADHVVFEGVTAFNRIPLAVWSHADH